MSVAAGKFIRDVMVFFPVKFDGEAHEDAWTDSMIRNLQCYSPDVLKRAAQKIIDTRDDKYARRFPLPAECKRVCDDIIKWDQLHEAPKLLVEGTSKIDGYDRAYRHADWLIMQAPIGKQAAKEGWALSLHDFIRVNGKLPADRHEIEKCKASAKGFDEAFAVCVRGEAGMLSRPLLGLGEAMLKRRHRIEDMVLHGVVK
jgi:hypothetical protein